MQFTEKDRALIIQIAKAQEKYNSRLDHLESHLHDDPEPSQNLQCNVVFQNTVPPKDRVAYSKQFQLELMSLMREYGVDSFAGTYERR